MSDENVGGLVELLPCPGCGCNRTRVIGGPGTKGGPKFWAGCDLCRWRTWGNTEEDAILSWNTRVSAHGQPVVDDQMVLNACAAFHGERWPDADSPFERQRMRAALIAALTGATT